MRFSFHSENTQKFRLAYVVCWAQHNKTKFYVFHHIFMMKMSRQLKLRCCWENFTRKHVVEGRLKNPWFLILMNSDDTWKFIQFTRLKHNFEWNEIERNRSEFSCNRRRHNWLNDFQTEIEQQLSQHFTIDRQLSSTREENLYVYIKKSTRKIWKVFPWVNFICKHR